VNFFLQFWAATHISTEIAPKWLAIDQNNLHTTFSALNVDFSNLSLDHLGSRRPVYVGVKEWYLSKKWLFICGWLIYFENGCR